MSSGISLTLILLHYAGIEYPCMGVYHSYYSDANNNDNSHRPQQLHPSGDS